MKSKKLISFLCATAMTVSSFAGLAITANAAQGDKIADIYVDDFNGYAVADIANGTDAGEVTAYIPISAEDPAEGVVGMKVVTTNRGNGGDRGWYTDTAGELVKTGSYYAIEQKADGDNYLHMSWPFFGDYLATAARWAHVDFTVGTTATTYTADATKDYVVEFDAKFINGMIAGNDDITTMSAEDAAIANPVLRLGTFAGVNTKAVEIDKKALDLGDGWVHIKSVTSAKGTKVFVGDSEVAVVNDSNVTAIAGFGLYTGDKGFNSPPLDVKGDSLDPANRRKTPAVDIDNLKIYTAEPEKEANITIKFVDASGAAIPGKADVTLSGIVGKKFAAPASYTANIDAEGDNYYKYTSGNDEITISETETANVITLKFTSTPKPTVTFKAVAGSKEIGTLGTAKAMPGTSVASEAYAHEYMQGSDGKWYQKVAVLGGRNNAYPTYNLAATVGDTDSVVAVQYVPAFDVVSFMEAEDDEGTTDGTYSGNYPAACASGGKWVQSASAGTYWTGFTTAPVEKDGTYTVTVNHYCDKNRPFAIGILATADTTTDKAVKVEGIESVGEGLACETFTVELEAGNCLWIGKNAKVGTTAASDTKAICDIDYIVVKDTTVEAQPTAVVGLTYDKATKTATLTQDLDYETKATLIHASYTNNALTDIESYNVTIPAKGGNVTQVLAKPVKAGDKLMVWDSLKGVKPLLKPAHEITAEEADPGSDVPPTPTKYTVTAGTVTGATVTEITPAEAEAGATVTFKVNVTDDTKEIDAVTVKPATGADITPTLTNGVYSFTMPEANVTINVTLKDKVVVPTKYTVTAGTVTGATVTEVTPAEAEAGATVTFKVNVTDDTKEIDAVTVKPATGADITPTLADGVYSFTMPAANVTINVTLKDKQQGGGDDPDPDAFTATKYYTFDEEDSDWATNGGAISYTNKRMTMKVDGGGNGYYYTRFVDADNAPESVTVEFDYTTTAKYNETSDNNRGKIYLASTTESDTINYQLVTNKKGFQLALCNLLDDQYGNAIYHIALTYDGGAKPTVTVNGVSKEIPDSAYWVGADFAGFKANTVIFRPGKNIADTVDNLVVYTGDTAPEGAPARYTVTTTPVDGVTYTVTKMPTDGVTEGTPITVTAEGAESISGTYGDGTALTITDGKFAMPAGNVTITATVTGGGDTPQPPTPATYSVEGTVDDVTHVTAVELQQDGAKKYDGNIADGKVTFTGVEAGEYDVVVTAAAGFTATVTPDKVTVVDTALTDAFAITTVADVVPVEQVTLTLPETVTAKVGDADVASGSKVDKGSDVVLTIAVPAGKVLKALTVNEADVTAQVEDNTYTIANIQADTTVAVEYEDEVVDYSIQIQGDEGVTNVTLTPAAETLAAVAGIQVASIGDYAIMPIASEGYKIGEVLYGTESGGTVTNQADFTDDPNEVKDINKTFANVEFLKDSALKGSAGITKDFSEPVTSGKVYFNVSYTVLGGNTKHIRLVDSDGKEVVALYPQDSNPTAAVPLISVEGTNVANTQQIYTPRNVAYTLAIILDLDAKTFSYTGKVCSNGSSGTVNATANVSGSGSLVNVKDIKGMVTNANSSYEYYLDNLALYSEVSTQTLYPYTINYKLNGEGEPVKVTTGSVAEGTVVDIETSFTTEAGKRYFVVDDDKEKSLTVSASGNNTLDINVREAEEYTISVKAVGDTTKDLSTVTATEGEKYSYVYPMFIVDENNIAYKATPGSGTYYGGSGTATANEDVEITYTKAYENVVLYDELDGATDNNANTRASNGSSYNNSEYKSSKELPAGEYKIFISAQSRGRGTSLVIGDLPLTAFNDWTKNAWETKEFDVTVETPGYITSVGAGSYKLDYLDVVLVASKTPLEPEPEEPSYEDEITDITTPGVYDIKVDVKDGYEVESITVNGDPVANLEKPQVTLSKETTEYVIIVKTKKTV